MSTGIDPYKDPQLEEIIGLLKNLNQNVRSLRLRLDHIDKVSTETRDSVIKWKTAPVFGVHVRPPMP